MISVLSFVGMQVSMIAFACFPELIIVLLETKSCVRFAATVLMLSMDWGVPASAAKARDMIAEWETLTYRP